VLSWLSATLQGACGNTSLTSFDRRPTIARIVQSGMPASHRREIAVWRRSMYSTGFSSGTYAGRCSRWIRPERIGYVLPHQAALVSPQAIPHHQQRSGDVPSQGLQELHPLRAADRSGKEAEVEVPPPQPSHRRQHLPVEGILQHGRLSLGRPGAATMGSLAQPAFVDEDDRAAFPLGFFLIPGQRRFFQCWIVSSLRSNARPVGRWQLQPNRRRMRQTWPGWYRIPNSRSIRYATR